MNTNISIEQLLQKPVAMMTGEELFFLLSKGAENKEKNMAPSVSKGYYYGIEGIAQIFGCSVPTANRIKKSGILWVSVPCLIYTIITIVYFVASVFGK